MDEQGEDSVVQAQWQGWVSWSLYLHSASDRTPRRRFGPSSLMLDDKHSNHGLKSLQCIAGYGCGPSSPLNSQILTDYPWLLSRATWRSQSVDSSQKGDLGLCGLAHSFDYSAGHHSDVLRSAIPHANYDELPGTDLSSRLLSAVQHCLQVENSSKPLNSSVMIASLLDAMHVLQKHVDALGGNIRGRAATFNTSFPPQNPHFKILHRVFCDHSVHCHDQIVYEDEPHFDGYMDWANEDILRGNKPIFNVETYLRQHSDLHFVVFKEHMCMVNNDIIRTGQGQKSTGHQHICARKERLWILSPPLGRLLANVLKLEVKDTEGSGARIKMEAPYAILFHYQRDLQEMAQRDGMNGVALKGLLTFVTNNYQEEYENARGMFNDGFVSQKHLEKLFRPNQVVVAYSEQTGMTRAAVLTDCRMTPTGGVALRGWCWTFDGTRLTRVVWDGVVGAIPLEPMHITDLAVHPYEFASLDVRGMLRYRGMLYWRIRNRAYLEYSGWDVSKTHEFSNARVMIDLLTYKMLHPQAEESVPVAAGDSMGSFNLNALSTDPITNHTGSHAVPNFIEKDAEISDETYLLLPPTVPGFNMQEKRWVTLDVRGLTEIHWNHGAFEQLVLPAQKKDLIKALLTTHVPRSEGFSHDIIQSRGTGLIILLHGPPGVGKTLTAESIAEYVRKPLYRVTCGDIGTDPESVEKYLESVLHIGKIWSSVVLLDEAEVFLEQRSDKDLQRNAMVSVFLRILEYYDGILILTSNRVGSFDDAFRSRIQLALRFESPDREARRKIWQIFLDSLMERGPEIDYDNLMSRVDQLAIEPLNGRQIRNAVTVGLQLAAYQQCPLDYSHIWQAIKVAGDFNNYLEKRSEQ